MSARRKPLTLAEADKAEKVTISALREPGDPGFAPLWILEHFSEEQRVQIRRLTRAGGFSAYDETIAALAAAALYVFQLDPIARDSFDRVSKAAGTDKADERIINSCINEVREAAEAWILTQRDAEREAALKGRAA